MGGEEPAPVETGQHENDREQDGYEVPDNHPALEAADEVAGQRYQKLFHAGMVQINQPRMNTDWHR